jgi:ABC-2 type transport system ATP-binding protein
MNGIDPGGRRDISRLLIELAEHGKTILVSSHILIEVEQLTESILMIARGRIVASGTLSEIRNLLDEQPFMVQIVAEPARRLAALLVESPEVESVEMRGEALTVRTRQPARFFAAVGDLVLDQGITVHQMETLDAGADAVFNYLEQGSP